MINVMFVDGGAIGNVSCLKLNIICEITWDKNLEEWSTLMQHCYIIEGKVQFIPSQRKLVTLGPHQEESALTLPASLCLEILLDNAPQPVHQTIFFKTVWEDSGMNVTVNTLYQNISLIRRGFNALGIDNVVMTLPRRGFKINDELVIEKKTAPAFKDANSAADESNISLQNEDTAPAPDFVTNNSSPTYQEKPPLSLFALGGGLLISAFFLIFSSDQHYLYNVDRNFFQQYVFFKNIGNCKIYIDSEKNKNNADAIKSQILIEKYVDCNVRPFVYITIMDETSYFLFSACGQNIITDQLQPDCISYRLREEVK